MQFCGNDKLLTSQIPEKSAHVVQKSYHFMSPQGDILVEIYSVKIKRMFKMIFWFVQ